MSFIIALCIGHGIIAQKLLAGKNASFVNTIFRVCVPHPLSVWAESDLLKMKNNIIIVSHCDVFLCMNV